MKEKKALAALSALSQESRLHVFRLLVRAGAAGLPAGAIAEEIGIPAATLSFHLKELAGAGLISASRHGRSIVYAVCVEGIRELLSYLTDDCCQGRPELCSLERFRCDRTAAGDRSSPR
jgi:DNA-binding transcriptional ArsR family regulator